MQAEIAELEKQLASLRRQAQKAERYRQYKAELRDLRGVGGGPRLARALEVAERAGEREFAGGGGGGKDGGGDAGRRACRTCVCGPHLDGGRAWIPDGVAGCGVAADVGPAPGLDGR